MDVSKFDVAWAGSPGRACWPADGPIRFASQLDSFYHRATLFVGNRGSWEIGVLISSAQAWNSIPGTPTSGGAHALTIILAVAITALLANVAWKKWRRRREARRDGGA